MTLVPLELRLLRRSGSLRTQIELALAAHGRPLRWAVTAVEGQAGVQDQLLCIEAVVIASVAGDGGAAGDQIP